MIPVAVPLFPAVKQDIQGKFLPNTHDLPQDAYRRLVGRRARTLIDTELGPIVSEDERRTLETEIRQHFEKIDQRPDFLPARFLVDGAERSRAVCRISTLEGLGTGFLIAPGILMTNNHVLPNHEISAASFAEFGLEAGSNAVKVVCRPERLFLTSERLDYTIVACDSVGIADIKHIRLLRNPSLAVRGESVNIIQHPAGRPKEIAMHNNDVIRVKDLVIHYHTDTEPGSSGSPVFNNEWKLVALHHAGFMENGRAINEGVRISCIVQDLEQRRAGLLSNGEAAVPGLIEVDDPAPHLGFFDTAGLDTPLEVQVDQHNGTVDFADAGFWNIEHFNNSVSDTRIKSVGEVLHKLAMDVMGLTEVESGALDRLVSELGSRGLAYDYGLQDAPGSQDIAVLYDQETTKVVIRNDLVDRYKNELEARTAAGHTAFPRKPLFAECEIGDGQGRRVFFLLIVVHLKAFGDVQSRARRRLAAEKLAFIIEDARERERTAVVLGGDFNERLNTDVLQAIKTSGDLFSLTLDDASDPTSASFVGPGNRSLIDHIVVSKDVKLGDISNDDAAIVRLDRSIATFADEVSDHVPVVFRMVFADAAVTRGT